VQVCVMNARRGDNYALDITRARDFSWAPKQSLRGTLPKLAEAMKEDPAKFYKENKLGAPPAAIKNAAARSHEKSR